MSSRNLALVLAAVLAFAFFIWPGQWKYDRLGEVPMRTHRVSGESELFAFGEWVSLGRSAKPGAATTDTTRMLGPFERMLVDGRGSVDPTGYFSGSIYNGTECTIKRIVYQIITKGGRDTTRRAFAETAYIPPRQTKDVIFRVDAYDGERRFVGWGIDSVEATCLK